MRSKAASSRHERLLPAFRSLLAWVGLPAGALVAVVLSAGGAQAQSVAKPTPPAAPQAAPQAVPGFWDPRRRPDRPDLSRLTVIPVLTETDHPPFTFTGPDGNPAGL